MSRPGAARTILLSHIISDRPSKQPLMVRTFLTVYGAWKTSTPGSWLFVVLFYRLLFARGFLVHLCQSQQCMLRIFPFVPLVSAIYASGVCVYAGYSPRSTHSFLPCLATGLELVSLAHLRKIRHAR
jgi:hypothetical protein